MLQQTNQVGVGVGDEQEDDDEWSPYSMAQRIVVSSSLSSNKANEGISSMDGKICVGSKDQVATPLSAQCLSDCLGWGNISVIHPSGHAVPMEHARAWRNDLLTFLDT